MKSLKKVIFILFVSILSISLIACSANEEEVDMNTQKENLGLIEFSTEEIIKDSENKIKKVANNFDNAKIVELNIYEDPLIMEVNKNEKKYNNIIIEVILNLSKDVDFKDRNKVTKNYASDIFEEFEHGDNGYFRLSNINVHYTIDGQTGKSMYKYEYSFKSVGEDLENLKVEQDEEDFKAQTLVFNSIKKNKEIELDRIGIENDSFIIQLRVFDPQEDGYDSILKPTSDDLSKLILENDEIKNYLIGKSVQNINIYWNMKWYKGDETIEYNYIIK